MENPVYENQYEKPQAGASMERAEMKTAKRKNLGKKSNRVGAWVAGVIGFLVVISLVAVVIFAVLRPVSETTGADQDLKKQVEELNMIVQLQARNFSAISEKYESLITDLQHQLQQGLTEVNESQLTKLQELGSSLNNSQQMITTQAQNLSNLKIEVQNMIQTQAQDLGNLKIEVQNVTEFQKKELNETGIRLQSMIQTQTQDLSNLKIEVLNVTEFQRQELNETGIRLQSMIQTQAQDLSNLKIEVQNVTEELNETGIRLQGMIQAQAQDLSNLKIATDTQSNNLQAINQTVKEQQNNTQVLSAAINNDISILNQTGAELQQKIELQQDNLAVLNIMLNETQHVIQLQVQNLNTTLRNEIVTVTENLTHSITTTVEESQKNLSKEIQLQTSTFNNSIQQQINNIRTEQNVILEAVNSTLSLPTQAIGSLMCPDVSPPLNGRVVLTAGPNSLSRGLQSTAAYSCDDGYALVGQTTRTCLDVYGGTSTRGEWSGQKPNCQRILCPEPGAPVDGSVVVSGTDGAISVGSTATYSCDTGFVLVGQTVRTCVDINEGTVGGWNGTMPLCQEIHQCPVLSGPSNGGILGITLGNHGVTLGQGAVATYYCDTGYGLVGQATRTCVLQGGAAAWTGTQPTCQELLTCPSLSSPSNGVITFTPGDGNSNIGLGSIATYSCNLGYVLEGQSTRTCGTSGSWTGAAPDCTEAVYCPSVLAPGNGSVVIISGVNYLSVGSLATFSCDDGFALLGDTTRTCLDQDSDSVGSWTGTQPYCQIILCPGLTPPENGSIALSTSGELGVGSTATYSCDTGFIVAGVIVRTCQSPSTGTTGTWTGNLEPSCAIPNLSEIDCQDQVCRYQQLVCPQQDNCTVHCYDSREYACFQTDVFCPSGRGDCTINCDDSYACLQVNATCTQGDCTINCENDYSCLNSALACSGDSCLVECQGTESCSNAVIESDSDTDMLCSDRYSCQYVDIQSSGSNFTLECNQHYSCQEANIETTSSDHFVVLCRGWYSCPDLEIQFSGRNLTLNCGKEYRSCYRSSIVCQEESNCALIFDGRQYGNWIGRYSTITCEENSTCNIVCTGDGDNTDYTCRDSSITCPSESGYCNVQCNGGDQACYRITITCGPNDDCLNCSGYRSCQQATINCPADNNCTINCDGQYSCDGASITCPTGDYSCNILCTDPLSCSNLSITNTDNVFLQCCGELSCAGTTVTPASTECPNIIP